MPYVIPQFRARIVITFTAILTLLGCSGQNLAGSWRGAIPWRSGDDCRIRLVPEGKFDLSCRDQVTGKTDEWVGAGSYEVKDGEIAFTFVALTQRGEVIKPPFPPLQMATRGKGNTLEMSAPNFASKWERIWKK